MELKIPIIRPKSERIIQDLFKKNEKKDVEYH